MVNNNISSRHIKEKGKRKKAELNSVRKAHQLMLKLMLKKNLY